MTIDNDLLHRFIFDGTDIRGEIITLNNCLNEMQKVRQYPKPIQALLGEFMAAVALMSNTLKFDGVIALQAQGDGVVPLIMTEANHNKKLRGIVKISDQTTQTDLPLPSLLGKGVLTITIDPDQGNRYQGIIPLESPTLGDCLEDYFNQSEQLPTKLWLVSDGNTASGLLLQQLPQQVANQEDNTRAWENRIQLANTITREELLSLDHKSVLTRLFHEDGVRFFDPTPFTFSCSCSKVRSSQALKYLGHKDAKELLLEQGVISVDCEFCGFQYTYDKNDVETIFSPKTRH